MHSHDHVRKSRGSRRRAPGLEEERDERQQHHSAVHAAASGRARRQRLGDTTLTTASQGTATTRRGLHDGGRRHGAARCGGRHRNREVGPAERGQGAIDRGHDLRRGGGAVVGPHDRLGGGQGTAAEACDGEGHEGYLGGRAVDSGPSAGASHCVGGSGQGDGHRGGCAAGVGVRHWSGERRGA